jgi:hypothetical protein
MSKPKSGGPTHSTKKTVTHTAKVHPDKDEIIELQRQFLRLSKLAAKIKTDGYTPAVNAELDAIREEMIEEIEAELLDEEDQ